VTIKQFIRTQHEKPAVEKSGLTQKYLLDFQQAHFYFVQVYSIPATRIFSRWCLKPT